MDCELIRIREAYERQLITEGWIWDGLKWIWRKIIGGDSRTADDVIPQTDNKPVGKVDTKSVAHTPSRDRAGFSAFGKGDSPLSLRQEVKRYSPADYGLFLKLADSDDTEWYWLTYKDNVAGLDKRDVIGIACVSHERLRPTVRTFATSKRADEGMLAVCRSKLVKSL